MKYLRDSKNIICNGSDDKTILIRTGYFNLINGYKTPFVQSLDSQGEYSTPPEPLCPVLRATHSVERAIFLFR